MANAWRCRCASALVVGVVLLGTGVWFHPGVLPWVAGLVVVLALVDACSVAMARRAVESYHRFMARVPLNGGNLPKAEEWLVLPGPDLGIRDAGSVLRALGSFSVWPFHAGVLALVVGFYLNSATPAGPASGAKSSSGPNKPLPATHVLSAPTPRPAPPGGSAAPVGKQTGPRTMQPGQPAQPGQPPIFSPLKPPQPQPGVRIPALPPRPQQPGTPTTGVPAKPPTQTGASQNGAPVQNGIPLQSPAPAPAPGAGATPALQPKPGAGGTPALQPAPPAK